MADQLEMCVNHPDRAAIEHCEVCGNALCGYCLYYTGDGQRLCETHAQQAKMNGVQIIPPAVYANGIIPAQAAANQEQLGQKPKGIALKNRPLYEANNHDVSAFIAMLLGIFSLSACCGAIYCFPFAAILMGIMALLNAKDAVDPRRTRQQGIVAILSGGVLAGFVVLCIVSYGALWGSAFALTNSNTAPLYFPSSTYSAPATTMPFATIQRTPEPAQRTATAIIRNLTATARAQASDTPTETP